MKKLSLILPTINAYKELDLCLESLSKNSVLENELIVIVDVDKKNRVNKNIVEVLKKRKINFQINKKNLGPYGSWNKGAKIAQNEILCFITDDQYFAPKWDLEIAKHMEKKYVMSAQIVEPGVLIPAFGTIMKDFGDRAENFQEKKFLKFVLKIKKDRLADGLFFIPLAIYKDKFFKLGEFSTAGDFGVKSVANDILFIKKAEQNGMKFKSSLSSISYHFQASSWEKQKKLRKWKNKLKLIIKKFI